PDWSPESPTVAPSGQGGLGGGEAGDRHARGRAAHVVEADLVEELDRGGVAAVLAANAELQVLAGGAATFGGDRNQLADAFLVDAGERILGHDFQILVGLEDRPRVVARHAQGGLGEVVGAEAEEL